jgi:predicted nucleic-acid-binding Zn-ribbon protein
MRNGVCPKCEHATVYSGRDIPAKNSSSNMIPIDFKNHAALDNYVCIRCGYVESYISDRKSLDKLANTWNEAGKNKKKRE